VINQFGNIAGGGKFVTSPTSVTATASGAVVNVTFVAATYDGKEIATYTVTSSPGNITTTGSSSPITVSGLTADTAYTFTVTTDSTYGVTRTSSPSNSATPPYFPPYFPPFFPPYFPPFFPPFFPPYFPPFFPPFFPPYFPPSFPPPCFAPSCGSCTPSSSTGTGALIGCNMPGCLNGCRYYTTTTTCSCTACTNACGEAGSVSAGCSTSNTGSVCI